jgi:hypothetical protein
MVVGGIRTAHNMEKSIYFQMVILMAKNMGTIGWNLKWSRWEERNKPEANLPVFKSDIMSIFRTGLSGVGICA